MISPNAAGAHICSISPASGASKAKISVSSILQRLIVLAVAVAFRGGEVAVLDIIGLSRRAWRVDRFAVRRLGTLSVFTGSAHGVPSGSLYGPATAHSRGVFTSISPPLRTILAEIEQSFLPFSDVQCKGRRNKEPT